MLCLSLSITHTHTRTNTQSSTLSAAAAVVALHKVSRIKEEDGGGRLQCATDVEKQRKRAVGKNWVKVNERGM